MEVMQRGIEKWQHIIKEEENYELFQIFEEINKNLRQAGSDYVNNGRHSKNSKQKCKGTQGNIANFRESIKKDR